MITCLLTSEPNFESYGRKWSPPVHRFGGQYPGSFMPAEGAIASALFTFPSLAEDEIYRLASAQDEPCPALFRELSALVQRSDRTFLRPVTEGLEV